jgi:cytochrome P450 / NADPH-cytochrome P450 reductase
MFLKMLTTHRTQQIQTLAGMCVDAKEREALQQASAQASSPTDRRPSILQLLRHYPSIKLPLDKLATMLPPLRPRQYSISSSPLANPSTLKLTWSLITHAPPASLPKGAPPTRGMASHYLAGLKTGDSLTCMIRRGNPRFKPVDPARSTAAPMIMVCAGSGIAPFRAFIEHRAEQLRRQPELQQQPPKALLYVGHRTPAHELYAPELKEWETLGAVEVRRAYSRGGSSTGQPEDAAPPGGCCYVQDRVWADREELCRLWEDGGRDGGARVYVCGGRGVSQGVRDVARRIYREQAGKRCGAGKDEDVEAWWVEALRERYMVEVF